MVQASAQLIWWNSASRKPFISYDVLYWIPGLVRAKRWSDYRMHCSLQQQWDVCDRRPYEQRLMRLSLLLRRVGPERAAQSSLFERACPDNPDSDARSLLW